MAFISPRGRGVKVFFKVDTTNADFIQDFASEDRDPVMKHHKVWYECALKELLATYPELVGKIDTGTNDPQQLTYIPFITNKTTDFKYDASKVSLILIVAKMA